MGGPSHSETNAPVAQAGSAVGDSAPVGGLIDVPAGAVADRRRVGRLDFANAHLIALLREPASADLPVFGVKPSTGDTSAKAAMSVADRRPDFGHAPPGHGQAPPSHGVITAHGAVLPLAWVFPLLAAAAFWGIIGFAVYMY